MLRANLDDIARKLVTHDGRMLGNIRMHTLVLGTKDRALVGGHADAVGYDLDQNLIIADFRQLKGIQTQIIRSMQTYSPCSVSYTHLRGQCAQRRNRTDSADRRRSDRNRRHGWQTGCGDRAEQSTGHLRRGSHGCDDACDERH